MEEIKVAGKYATCSPAVEAAEKQHTLQADFMFLHYVVRLKERGDEKTNWACRCERLHWG